MVNVLALRFNAVRVAMGHSDFCLSPLRARAAYAGGMLTIEKISEQTPDEKIAELAVPESEPRRAARALYWKGWRISSIARHLGIKRSTINSWKLRDEWDKAQAIEHVEASAELAAHRVPPQLMGILPNNAGGFGAVEPAARVFARNELVPLQAQFMAINEWAGVEVVRFAPYDLATGGEGTA